MVKVVIQDTGELLDVMNGEITYIKQASDIGDISKINTSYSWSMKFPKTPQNTKIFKGLGLVGSQSRIPYQLVKVSILDNGFPIVKNGNLEINSTEENEYKGNIQDGIIDFYKDIQNDKISPTIDLSDLTHENTVTNIFESWENDLPYRYLIASYNGEILPDGGTTNISRNGILPSINVGYLFDKIMAHYGWTYSGLDASGDWMTYPTAPAPSEATGLVVADLKPEFIERISSNVFQTIQTVDFTVEGIDNDYVTMLNESLIRISQLTTYTMEVPEAVYLDTTLETYAHVNHQEVGSGMGRYTVDLGSLETGDIITIRVQGAYHRDERYTWVDWNGNLLINSVGGVTINFNKALIKYKVKDFFKEIMMQNALTAFADPEKKHIDFLNIDQRLNADIIDWSDKFVKRKSEAYVYKTYAQNNYLQHKYDEEGQDYADGNLAIDNRNLEIEKTLYESKSYAPLEGYVEFHDALNHFPPDVYNVPIFKMFDIEIKEVDTNDDGTLERVLTYEPLEERFYFVTQELVARHIFVDDTKYSNFFELLPFAIPKTWNKIVSEKYQTMQRILSDTKAHKIDLILDQKDLTALSLKKRYYFKQEGANYLFNKLIWKSREITTGEFIRII